MVLEQAAGPEPKMVADFEVVGELEMVLEE